MSELRGPSRLIAGADLIISIINGKAEVVKAASMDSRTMVTTTQHDSKTGETLVFIHECESEGGDL